MGPAELTEFEEGSDVHGKIFKSYSELGKWKKV